MIHDRIASTIYGGARSAGGAAAISAAIGGEKGPFGRVFGDLLVRQASASGHHRKRRIAFEMDNGHHLPGLNHFQLLNHPAVYEQMRLWLGRGAPAPSAPAALPSPA